MDKNKLPFRMKNIKNAIIDSHVKVEGNLAMGDTINYNLPLPKDVPFNKFKLSEATIPRIIVEEKSDIYAHQAWLYPDGDIIPFNASLSHFIKENPKTLLLGGAGYGKTTELKQLYNQILAEGIFKPFFIDLGKGNIRPIENYQPNLQVFDAKDLVILIDSLDEPSQMLEAIDNILQFTNNKGRGANIVVSCRTNVQSQNLADFQPCFLQLLRHQQIQEYVSGRLGAHSDTFLTAITANNLYELIQIPFYLEQLIAYFEDNEQTIPNDKNGLFEYLVNKSIDTKLQPATGMAIDQKVKKKARIALEKLAFSMQCLQVSGMTEIEVAEFIEDDEERSLLQKSSSLLDTTDGNWSFKHLNFQEYLAAVKIANLPFKKIKKLIGIKGFKHNRIHPKWLNTLSFVFPLLAENSLKRREFIEWLQKNESHFILGFEPERLTDEFRGALFIDIMEDYKVKETYLDYHLPIGKLIKFIKTNAAGEYLIEEIENKENKVSSSNMLAMLSFAELTDIPSKYRDKLKKLLWGMLTNSDNDFKIKSTSLNLHATIFRFNEDEIEEIMSQHFYSADADFQELLLSVVNESGFQENFIDEMLHLLKNGLGTLNKISANFRLESFFENLYSLDSILKYLRFYKDNFEADVYQELRKINEIIFEKAVNIDFTENQEFWDLVKGIIDKILWLIPSYESLGLPIIKYLEKSEQKLKMLESIYSDKEEFNQRKRFQSIALSDSEGMQFLADEFQKDTVPEEFIIAYHRSLFQFKRELFDEFHERINQNRVNKIPVPTLYTQEDADKETLQRINLTKEILFNKGKYILEVHRVFGEKTLLNRDDGSRIYDEHWKEKKHNHFLVSKILRTTTHRNIVKELFIKRIETHWDCCFAIREIDIFIKENPKAEFNKEESGFINKWCQKKIKTVDFSTASNHTLNRESVRFTEELIAYFITKFKFDDFEESDYLDMFLIHIQDAQHSPDFIKFAEKEIGIPKNKITERVIANLRAGIEMRGVLSSHLNYCTANSLQEIAPELLKYLTNPVIWNRQHVLDSYFLLEGELADLEQVLPQIQSDFQLTVIWKLIEHKSLNIEEILLTFFQNSEGNAKNDYAKMLLNLQNIDALRHLLNEMSLYKTSLLGNHYDDIYKSGQWENEKALILWVKLYLIGINDDFKDEEHRSISLITKNCISSIAKINYNKFSKLDWRIQRFIVLQKSLLFLPDFLRKKFNLEIEKPHLKNFEEFWNYLKFEHYANQIPEINDIKVYF
jgi:hypothetical protein